MNSSDKENNGSEKAVKKKPLKLYESKFKIPSKNQGKASVGRPNTTERGIKFLIQQAMNNKLSWQYPLANNKDDIKDTPTTTIPSTTTEFDLTRIDDVLVLKYIESKKLEKEQEMKDMQEKMDKADFYSRVIEEYTPISPRILFDYVNRFVIGQEKAKKDISSLLYNHWNRYLVSKLDLHTKSEKVKGRKVVLPSLNGLIIGPTGTGKTEIIKRLSSSMLKLPFVKVDATSLTGVGWEGEDIEDLVIKSLYDYAESGGEIDKLPFAVIYIDEFDKMGSGNMEGSRHDKWYNDKQFSLLKLMDGKDLNICHSSAKKYGGNKHIVNSENFLFIFSGSFQKLLDDKKEEKHNIGFKRDVKPNEEDSDNGKNKHFTKQELVEKGFMVKELLGRIHVLTSTQALTREQMKSILFDVEDNIIDKFTDMLFLGDLESFYDEDDDKENELISSEDIDKIVDKAFKSEFGARFLSSSVFELLSDKIYDLEEIPMSLFFTDEEKEDIKKNEFIEDELKEKLL